MHVWPPKFSKVAILTPPILETDVTYAKKTDVKVADVKKTKTKVRVAKSSDLKKLLSDVMQENNGGKSILGDGTR